MSAQTSLSLITKELVPEDQRMIVTNRLFAIHFPLRLEPVVFGITEKMATEYNGGYSAFDEELFGPVAAIISAKDEKEAINLANNSVFGLGAAVFTENIALGEKIASGQLEAGSCFVNDFVKSDPRLPFGGIKQSGYGRELSDFGIREFVNIKTVYVK